MRLYPTYMICNKTLAHACQHVMQAHVHWHWIGGLDAGMWCYKGMPIQGHKCQPLSSTSKMQLGVAQVPFRLHYQGGKHDIIVENPQSAAQHLIHQRTTLTWATQKSATAWPFMVHKLHVKHKYGTWHGTCSRQCTDWGISNMFICLYIKIMLTPHPLYKTLSC